MNDNEQKVFAALGDGRWDWRTLDGLKRSTGLPGAAILEIILNNRTKVDFEVMPSRDNLLFRLKDHKGPRTSIIDDALDMLSLGSRDKSV
jgi:hypothetical protein